MDFGPRDSALPKAFELFVANATRNATAAEVKTLTP
jgi:hypothetical protein